MLDKIKNLQEKYGPRVKAWWNGADMPSSSVWAPADVGLATAGASASMPVGKPLWSGDRITLLRQLWGEGNAAPNEPDFFGSMYSQLALNSTMTILDIGDGMGGVPAQLAKQYKVYVDAHISNPEYIPAAEKYIEQHGVQQHVRLFPYNLENFKLEKKYDVISIRRVLWRVPDVPRFLNTIAAALKDNGRLVMADYVSEAHLMTLPLMNSWFLQEQFMCSVSLGDVLDVLPRANLDVRVSTDITKPHLQEIKRGLKHLQEFLQTVRVNDETKIMILTEADRWAVRANLMHEGLQLFRFFAQKKS
jgi:cyclopropane fatty-acyl-phospholipid synthase-like methyltransferase